jgi:hypothetical protein
LAVSYFGQTLLIWLFIIGIAGAHRQWSRVPQPLTRPSGSLENRVPNSFEWARRRPGSDRRREVEPLPIINKEAS